MATLAEIEPVEAFLSNLLIGEPLTHGALTVVPLLAPVADEPDWLTLAEAGDRVRVTEVSEAGTVPFLKVANLADRPLLLLDGEQLVGAKQNRILNTTVLVAAASELTIPVTCVEHGRWGYRRREMSPSDVSLYASVRRRKSQWVSQALRAGQGHMADQAQVWDDLADRDEAHGVHSPTSAMADFYLRYEEKLSAARKALEAIPGQVGAIVYLSGQWVGLDLLAGPRLFGAAWPRLCAGYAADALGKVSNGQPVPSASTVLGILATCPAELAPAVGLGEEYRLAGQVLVGAALIAYQRLAHLMAFPRVSDC